MHWADKIANEIVKSGKFIPYWVDDMKTPSGYAHIGSMLGPVVHSAIYRSLKDLGKEVTLTYIFNDFDVADEFPPNFKEELKEHAGKVLRLIPSPVEGFESLAHLLSDDLKKSIGYLGFEAKYLSSYDMYKEGKFNEVIKVALDNSEKIQEIYQKISGSQKKAKGWLPFQVTCEKCGKLGTTLVFDWDGEMVSYRCEEDLVTWAKGCGYAGKISPFNGTGKLPWKVDWAAHWKVLGVTIELAGKDHGSKGGSFDIATTILKEVFKGQNLYKKAYEFLLIGGKKMSSSKGIGLKAHDLVNILPAELARFLFIGKDLEKQSNWDPNGTMSIPDLFDEYDKAWESYTKNLDEDLSRTYVLSQIGKVPEKEKGFYAPRFIKIANFISQGLGDEEVLKKLTEDKGGKIDDSELSVVEERIKYAKIWLERYAPSEYRFEMTEKVPDEVNKFTDLQKEYLNNITNIFNQGDNPESLQISLYELSKSMKIPTKDAFSAIYISLIGKTHGPRAGMLLINLGREKVIKRFEEVFTFETPKIISSYKFQVIKNSSLLSFSDRIKKEYSSLVAGVAVIRDIKVLPLSNELEQFKMTELDALKEITVDEIEKSNEILSYRRMYKEMGIDWAKKKSSPAALLRRIAQGKGLYTINTCVDAYNLVVMKYKISAGAFDLDQMNLPAILDIAKGDEESLFIGDKELTKIKSGEICYFDQIGAYNLDLNYRDSVRTSVTEKTKNVIINTEGVYDISRDQVERTLEEVIKNILKYCGGKLESAGIVTSE